MKKNNSKAYYFSFLCVFILMAIWYAIQFPTIVFNSDLGTALTSAFLGALMVPVAFFYLNQYVFVKMDSERITKVTNLFYTRQVDIPFEEVEKSIIGYRFKMKGRYRYFINPRLRQ